MSAIFLLSGSGGGGHGVEQSVHRAARGAENMIRPKVVQRFIARHCVCSRAGADAESNCGNRRPSATSIKFADRLTHRLQAVPNASVPGTFSAAVDGEKSTIMY